MSILKKSIALLLTALMICSIVPITAFADSIKAGGSVSITVGEEKQYAAAKISKADKLKNYVKNLDAFKNLLFQGFYNSNAKISIISYKLPFSQEMADAISAFKEEEMMEIFNVKTFEVVSDNQQRYIDYIKPVYKYSATTYKNMISKVYASAENLYKDIKGNSALGEVEKALLLHDRLALLCDYDYTGYISGNHSEHIYDIYGVFVDKKAVCQGYAEAYDYLLECVGIKSEICVSDALNHAWNIVTIGGQKYHVDVTWDDPVNLNSWDVQGEVLHNNFLLSSNALYYGVNGYDGHKANDYDTTPKSTKYDNAFWQNSDTAFQLIGNEIYYIDNDNAVLKRYSDKYTLVTINAQTDKWPGYSSNFSRLTSDGKYLYFSTAKHFYGYDTRTGELVKLHTPNLNSNYSIYGFEYVGNDFVYDVNTSADFNSKYAYRYTLEFDIAPPTFSTLSTYGPTASQTITITMQDNSGIAGYWLGNNENYTLNKFYPTSSKKVNVKITQPGTYYIVIKDVFGNISELYHYFVYSKITLNANGGTVSPKYIVSVNNETIKLPTPTRPGYIFNGWATSKTAKSGIKNLKVTANKTYYALWKANKNVAIYKVNGTLTCYKNGKIYKANTLVKYNGKYYHVNNGKWVKDTTLVKVGSTYYYVKNGIKNTSNTLVKYKNKFYHVKSGKWVKDTTLVKVGSTYYYVKNGIKNTSNTLVKYNNKSYHVKNGKWVKDTAIVKYGSKRYYVKGGVVQKVTKTVKVSGRYYRLKKGIVS